jgi:Fic family protein
VRLVAGRLEERSFDLQAFVPDPLPPKIDHRKLLLDVHPEVLVATRELARLDGIAHWMPDPYLLLYTLLAREAKMSSRIENTIASIEEVSGVELNPKNATNDARLINNYVKAMRLGMDSPLPVCKRLILDMHRSLLEGVRGEDKTPGRFRDNQVVIGDEQLPPSEARFVPPPPGPLLVDAVDRWEKFVNSADPILPEIVTIAISHYQFEAIHPFRDGNGRIGRAIANLSLCKGPTGVLSRPLVYVSGFIDKHRQAYYDLLLRVSTKGDWASWVRFFCGALAAEARDSSERIRRVLDLRSDYIRRVSKPKDSASLARLVDFLFQHPVLNIAKAAELLGLRVQSAARIVARLEERGVITETTAKDYGRSWAARELLAIIEDENEPT